LRECTHKHVWDLYRAGTTRITPPVTIDLYDKMLRSIDQPASCMDFAIPLVFASLFGLTSARSNKETSGGGCGYAVGLVAPMSVSS
jgi:hypothetical protein